MKRRQSFGIVDMLKNLGYTMHENPSAFEARK